MILNKFSWVVIGLLIVFPVANRAQLDGRAENICRNGAFPRETSDFKLAKVTARKGEKVYFYTDERNCPNDVDCQDKSYLIAGDTAIVSRTYGDFACVWFEPKKGAETVGWIKTDKLKIYEPNQNPQFNQWFGKWNAASSSIRIKSDPTQKTALSVNGEATWGAGNNVHVGEVDASAAPAKNILSVKEKYGCAVVLRLVGEFLVVSDNFGCGGVNVTFSGVYKKALSRKMTVKTGSRKT